MKEEKGFKSRLGFILASVGSAVGLGNLWAFPHKVGANGGAVFVLVYIIMAVVIGLVALISETYIGKRTGKNIIDSYRAVNKHMGWMGILGLVCTVVISSYYIVLGGWVFKYVWSYLVGTDFTATSIVDGELDAYGNFFINFSSGSWEPILFMAIFFILAMLVLIFGVQKGIEKISKVLMPLLFFMMIGLMIWSLCLGGRDDAHSVLAGLQFYLVPRADSFSSQTVLAAMGQSFFSLSIGVGIMCVYGSYAKDQKGIGKSALVVVIMDTIVALLAGFIIFPAIFALGNGPADIKKGGPALFFMVLPRIFAEMGGAGRFFGFVFFFLVFVAAITSVISLVEVPLQAVIQKTKIKRPVAVAIFTAVIFVLAVLVSLSQGYLPSLQVDGMGLIDFFDGIISNYMMPIGSMAACVMVGWLISKKEIDENFSDFKARKVWIVFAKYITPVLIGIILITSGILKMEKGEPVRFNNWKILVTVIVAMVVFVSLNEIINHVNEKKNPQMAISAAVAKDFTTEVSETSETVVKDASESIDVADSETVVEDDSKSIENTTDDVVDNDTVDRDTTIVEDANQDNSTNKD